MMYSFEGIEIINLLRNLKNHSKVSHFYILPRKLFMMPLVRTMHPTLLKYIL